MRSVDNPDYLLLSSSEYEAAALKCRYALKSAAGSPPRLRPSRPPKVNGGYDD